MKKLIILNLFLVIITAHIRPLETTIKRGIASFHHKNKTQAQQQFRTVLQEDPNNIEALKWLGITHFYANEFETARSYLKQCVVRAPKDPNILQQYAMICDHTGEFEKARAAFEALHDFNRRFEKPWVKLPPLYIRNMEWYYVKKFIRDADELWWYNADITNKTVLLDLTSEWNGCGDVMQTVRYAKHLHAAGAGVTVQVRTDMIPLLSLCPYIDRLLTPDQEKPDSDHTYKLTTDRCIVRMRNLLYEPSGDVPYLFADESLVTKWAQRLSHDTNYKVGLCWQSVQMQDYFTGHLVPGPKSLTLDQLKPLFAQTGVSFYSLHKDADTCAPLISFDDLDTDAGPFMDSAALIHNLDLVITVDTSIAHLAGAMGKKVWLLLPYASDFRWFEQTRTDSPLYPTMRLFHQPNYGDWKSVMRNVCNAIDSLTTIQHSH